jgi:hypothetical protein
MSSPVLERYHQALRASGIKPPAQYPADAVGPVAYQQIYNAITATTGSTENLGAFSWWYDQGHAGIVDQLAALEHRCEGIARDGAPEAEYRAAVEALVAFMRGIRALYRQAQLAPEPGAPLPPEPQGPWRVVVERRTPLAGPIHLDAATTISNPARCIERTLIDLERAVAYRNAGRETAYTDLIDEKVERLAASGCRVRVEAIS